MNAPADPKTPIIATMTALSLCPEVGVGKEDSIADVVVLLGIDPVEGSGGEEVKKLVGRAIITTPRREVREAYWADRGKGSLRKR